MKKWVLISALSVFMAVLFAFTALAEPTAVTPYYTWTKDPGGWSCTLFIDDNPPSPGTVIGPYTPGDLVLSASDQSQYYSWIGFDYGDDSSFKALFYDTTMSVSDVITYYGWACWGFNTQFMGSLPLVPNQTTQSGFVTFWLYAPLDPDQVKGSFLYMCNADGTNTLNQYIMSTVYIGQHPEDPDYYGFTCSWTITNDESDPDSVYTLAGVSCYSQHDSVRYSTMPKPPIAISRMVVTNGTWDPQYIPDYPRYLDGDTFRQDVAQQLYDSLTPENAARDALFGSSIIASNHNGSLAIVGMFNQLITSCPFIGNLVTVSAIVGLVGFIFGLAPSIISHHRRSSKGKKGGGSS